MKKQEEIAQLKKIIPSVQPAFDDKSINICMSANNKYATCLTVCIYSILKNSNKNDKYDIVILEKDLSDEYKCLLKKYENEHVSIRFYSMSNIVDSVTANLYTYSYFSIEVYFRFFIPYIFIDYAKVLYLDCDAVCLSDIAEVYNQDLGNNIIGAVKDIIALQSSLSEISCKKYQKKLKTENVLNYVNSGVILFDIKKLIDFDFVTKALDLTKYFVPIYPDQCIINKIANGHIKYLNLKYNSIFHYNHLLKDANLNLNNELYNELKDADANPVFFHYIGPDKPWHDTNVYKAHLFWQYAKETSIYERILFDNYKCMIQDAINYRKNKWQLFKYRIFYHLLFGEAKKRCKEKKCEYKAKLKNARTIIKL